MRKPCCDKKDTNKGAWSKQEDQKLIDYIRAHGEGCWRSLPKAAGLLRCGKSCRLRWINYLRPDLKRGNFGQDEEDLIIKLHALLGNRWSLIAGRLPGRTDNEVKNYWNSHIKRKLLRMGIDPNNHRLNSSRIIIQPPPPPQFDDDYNQCTTSTPTTTATSPSNKNKIATSESQPPLKSSGNDNNDDKVKANSDTTSCLEEELSTLPLDVNLDLTISTFPIEMVDLEKKKIEDDDTVMVNKEVESSDQDHTLLLLFR